MEWEWVCVSLYSSGVKESYLTSLSEAVSQLVVVSDHLYYNYSRDFPR